MPAHFPPIRVRRRSCWWTEVGREAGLATALRGTQPSATGVRVQLEGAPFDTLLTWLDTLDRRYGLAIESITVDRTVTPGLVNASISFAQPRH